MFNLYCQYTPFLWLSHLGCVGAKFCAMNIQLALNLKTLPICVLAQSRKKQEFMTDTNYSMLNFSSLIFLQ